MRRIGLLAAVLVLITASVCYAQDIKNEDRMFVDIGLGMNYSAVNNDAFLTPKLGLEFLLTDAIKADISFGFETHSVNFSGIQNEDIRYFIINLLGKYFINENIYAGAGFGYAMFLSSTTVNAVPATPGEIHPDVMRLLLSAGYFSQILDGIYLDPSLLFSINIPTEESDSFDFIMGLVLTISLGISR